MRSKRTFWIITLALILTALIGAVSVMAAYPTQQADDSVLIPLLQQLLAPAVLGAVVGVVLSFGIELVPSYEQLKPKFKRLVFFGLCLLFSIGAGVAIPLIAGKPLEWDPIVGNAIVASLAAMSGGTLAHTGRLPAA